MILWDNMMDVFKYNDQEFITLTYEEEHDLALKVMDYMSLRWVWGDLQALLERIYHIKCLSGGWLNVEDILTLLQFTERYELDPPFFNDDGNSIISDLDKRQYPTNDSRNLESRRMIIMAWREVWESHDKLKTIADKFKAFAGDSERSVGVTLSDTEMAIQELIEVDFWAEVCRVEEEFNYKCSRQEAFIQVSDYMPRGYSSD